MVLLRVGRGGFADPGAVGMCLATPLHPLHIAGTLALDDGLEFGPVELAEVIVAALLVPLQVWVFEVQAKGCLLYTSPSPRE